MVGITNVSPSRRNVAALCLLLSVAVACGHGVLYAPGASQQAQWLQASGDAGGSGLLVAGPEPPLRLQWQQKIGKPPLGSPLLSGELLLQWSKAPDLYAFEIATGTRVGKRGSDDPVCGPPALAGEHGRLMLVSILADPSQLRAIDRTSGDIVWRQDGVVCGDLVVRGDTAFVAKESGQVQAIAVEDGKILWTLELAPPLSEAPSLSDSVIFVADGKGKLVAATIDGGELLWRRNLGTAVRSRAAIGPQGSVFAAVDGGLYALDPDTGKTRWQAEFTGLPTAGLFVSEKVVAVGSTDRSLSAFDPVSGHLLWRCETQGIVRGAPVGTEQTIYVGAGDGWIHAVDHADGTISWQQELDGPVLTSAALNWRSLAVTTERGTTYLFSAK